MTVYFVRRVGGVGPLKVGHSVRPIDRLLRIQEWSPHELELVTTLPGGAAEEREIHGAFSAARIRREWFKATSGLLALVDYAKARESSVRLSFAELDRFAAMDGSVREHRGAAYERVVVAAERAGVSVSSPYLQSKTGLSGAMVGAHALRGRDVLSQTVAREIGRVLKVNSRWLRDGTGPMVGS